MASFSATLQILTVVLIAVLSGVRAKMSGLPPQPVAVTPPGSTAAAAAHGNGSTAAYGSDAYGIDALQLLLAVPPQPTATALPAWGEELVVAANGLQQRCEQVANGLRSFRKDGISMGGSQIVAFGPDNSARLLSGPADLAKLGVVLGGLRGLESPARQVLVAIRTAAGVVRDGTRTDQSAIEKGLETLPGVRDRLLICLLGVVGKARGLMAVIDEKMEWSPTSSSARVEALAIEEAEADPNNTDVKFGLGLYWSDVAMTSSEAAGSSDAWWVRDSEGASAPSLIVRAETLLQDSQLATETPMERRNRAATRALRLYQHAEFMARKEHTAAAVWRYRMAASLAHGSQRSRMSMQSLEMDALTRLAYLLDRSGKDAEALEAVTEALDVHRTSATSRIPLAIFLQTTLRRRLGELKSDSDVRDAEMQLLAVEGRLPYQTLENERADAHAEFVAWRNVDETPTWSLERFKKCWGMNDAARALICMLCTAVFS